MSGDDPVLVPATEPDRAATRYFGSVPARQAVLVPISIVIVAAIVAVVWWRTVPHGPRPPVLVFENPLLGCRFEYPSALTAGPNFVRADSGSILTIERHSLDSARKDWVAALPEVLFPQVMIQLGENYVNLAETSRTPVTVADRKGIEVVLTGHRRESSPTTVITILIFANEEWVYVLRTYSFETLDPAERPLFRRVRETWAFLPEGGQVTPS